LTQISIRDIRDGGYYARDRGVHRKRYGLRAANIIAEIAEKIGRAKNSDELTPILSRVRVRAFVFACARHERARFSRIIPHDDLDKQCRLCCRRNRGPANRTNPQSRLISTLINFFEQIRRYAQCRVDNARWCRRVIKSRNGRNSTMMLIAMMAFVIRDAMAISGFYQRRAAINAETR